LDECQKFVNSRNTITKSPKINEKAENKELLKEEFELLWN